MCVNIFLRIFIELLATTIIQSWTLEHFASCPQDFLLTSPESKARICLFGPLERIYYSTFRKNRTLAPVTIFPGDGY